MTPCSLIALSLAASALCRVSRTGGIDHDAPSTTPLTPPRNYTADIEMLRQQVATLAQRWQGGAPPPPSMAEAAEELFVTVEELHAVNEELTRTEQAAIRDQLRYRELFELAPDGYLVTDLHGTIQEANRAAAALLNIMPHRLPGVPLVVFIASEARQPFRAQMA